MKLYASPASPFVRKTRVVLIETGLLAQTEVIDVAASPLKQALDQPNPLGKIPALAAEGQTLVDSRVICRYLDARAGTDLYPDGAWDVLTLEAMADGVMEAAVLVVYEQRFRPEAQQSAEWMDGQWSKVARALDWIDSTDPACLQNALNIAQIALGCALGYLDLRHSDRNWRDGRPRLAAWDASFSRRPAMQQTRPEA